MRGEVSKVLGQVDALFRAHLQPAPDTTKMESQILCYKRRSVGAKSKTHSLVRSASYVLGSSGTHLIELVLDQKKDVPGLII